MTTGNKNEKRKIYRYPEIDLNHLRKIAWEQWNPLSVHKKDNNVEFQKSACVSEYDNHLIHVVMILSKGSSKQVAVNYLQSVVGEYISATDTERRFLSASRQTVESISRYLKEK